MIGIIPSYDKTFEVYGDLSSKELVEGKLYYDKSDNRVYYYSLKETRSNPNTGYYPVWDGKNKYVTSFSNKKYFDKDVTIIDLDAMCSNINKEVADQVIYMQRRSDNNEILRPEISDGDNMFTQCIKGIINSKELTMVDLVDMTSPKLQQKMVENYYSALTKITFMRLDKWNIWIDVILHVNYIIDIFKDDKKLLSFNYQKNIFDTGIVKYNNITSTNDDPFKKIIKILMIMENISKNDLRSEEVDDYTINNMMTTLNSNKPLSAQIFSRFIRMAKLSYIIKIYDKNNIIFEYQE